MEFAGHVNSYTERLGLSTDPDKHFVFAAGQDKRLRGWSLRTGQQLAPQPTHSNTTFLPTPDSVAQARTPHILHREFVAPVPVLQVKQDEKGLCLWAVAGSELYYCLMGHTHDREPDNSGLWDGWHTY